MTISHGEVFRHELAGGGGWGDPLERDPALVLKDVRDELVSTESAQNDYGVVVDTDNWAIDEAATETLRSELRGKRPWHEPPSVSWDDQGTETALDAAD